MMPMIVPSFFLVFTVYLGRHSSDGLGQCSPMSPRNLLAIGVFSAQNNSERREAIRETWGSLTDGRSSVLKFIVGRQFCYVPPEDRVTPYGCDTWTPQLPKSRSSLVRNFDLSEIKRHYVFNGYTFILKQAIELTEISVCGSLLSVNNQRVRVVVKNSRTDDIVASATFLFDNRNTSNMNELMTKRITPTKLEPDFEGELMIVTWGNNADSSCGMFLTEETPLYVFECHSPLSGYVPMSSFDGLPTVLAGLGYYIEDPTYWKNNFKRRAERAEIWNRTELVPLSKKLLNEQNKYDDMFWVFHVDTYSSLSKKFLDFFHWAQKERFQFLLKTDDDVFVNLTAVLKELSAKKHDWDWWSCFHTVDWPPPNSGKWRDRVSTKYPEFPSGSGYVLRMSSALRMDDDVPLVAGEDVTVGRMAEGKRFVKLNESTCYWACGPHINQLLPCNVPEVDSEGMKRIWQSSLDRSCLP